MHDSLVSSWESTKSRKMSRSVDGHTFRKRLETRIDRKRLTGRRLTGSTINGEFGQQVRGRAFAFGLRRPGDMCLHDRF